MPSLGTCSDTCRICCILPEHAFDGSNFFSVQKQTMSVETLNFLIIFLGFGGGSTALAARDRAQCAPVVTAIAPG